CKYYSIDSSAGLKMDQPLAEGKYAFLDDPEISNSFYRYHKERMAKVLFFIPGMHCASCIWLLERLYKLLPGVQESRVNFDRKELSVEFDPQEISLRQRVEKLTELGYEPALLPGEDSGGNKHSLLYRLGVAGFCAGNIMLFSFPEYLGMDEVSRASFSTAFQWINFILALPVVLYSAQPFYLAAWKGLLHK